MFDTLRKLKDTDWKQACLNLVYDTQAEVVVGALAGVVLAGLTSFAHEDAKKGQIPLAFSEISHTRLILQLSGGQPVPSMTEAYSDINDVHMQFAEASNLAYGWNFKKAPFAYELEKKIDPSMRVHTLISDYAEKIKPRIDTALQTVQLWTSADQDLKPVIEALQGSWDDSHYDVTHTVYHKSCTTSQGKETCTTTSEEVYDKTINTYDYHPKQGRQAARLLNDFVKKYPDLTISQQLLLVPQTGAENEWAMRQSRKKQVEKKALTQEDYIQLTNVWATSSNYNVEASKITQSRVELGVKAPQWDAAKNTARDERNTTYDHSHDEPEEFTIAQGALQSAESISSSIEKVTGGFIFARDNIPVLSKLSQEFVNVTLHGAEGNAGKLEHEIRSLDRKIYEANFTGGFDTQPSKWGMVFLWSALGLFGGGALGYGADRLIGTGPKNTIRNYRSRLMESRNNDFTFGQK